MCTAGREASSGPGWGWEDAEKIKFQPLELPEIHYRSSNNPGEVKGCQRLREMYVLAWGHWTMWFWVSVYDSDKSQEPVQTFSGCLLLKEMGWASENHPPWLSSWRKQGSKAVLPHNSLPKNNYVCSLMSWSKSSRCNSNWKRKKLTGTMTDL